jgi:hypothetical protein
MRIASTAVFAQRAILPPEGSPLRLAALDASRAGAAEERERLVVRVDRRRRIRRP